MTDVRTPDPAKASPNPGPPDRELREQLEQIIGSAVDYIQGEQLIWLIQRREAALLQRVRDELIGPDESEHVITGDTARVWYIRGRTSLRVEQRAVLDNIIGGEDE